MNPITFISSDGHAAARMPDYRAYLEASYLADFDEFLVAYAEHGSRNFEPPALLARTDPEIVDEWETEILDNGRAEGFCDPTIRLRELDREGIAGEVLFPDFGLPFELYSVEFASALGIPPRSEDQVDAANRAHNRWLADFCQVAPERFAAQALISWRDTDAAIKEIRWAKDQGFKGIVLPKFDPAKPLYHESYDPIWTVLEEVDLVVNSHQGMSGTTNVQIATSSAPIPCATRLHVAASAFFTHDILSHLVWGGVMERHPGLRFAFTETGSGWVIGALREMDYAYESSYLRRDVRDIVRVAPSEYFARQCFLGSSIFSLAEIGARHEIGMDKMMIGADYPHHEGTLLHGTRSYLRATFGVAAVPEGEARQLLGANAAAVFDFDMEKLDAIAARIGYGPSEVLVPPDADYYPRGDVHRPLSHLI